MAKTEKAKGPRPLTPKQEMFCQVYVSTGNATEAYRQAYDTANMKYTTIMEAACRLTNDSKISARVKELMDERAKRYNEENIKAQVVDVCVNVINSDVTDMFEVDPETGKVRLRNVKQMPKELRASIKRVSSNKGSLSFEFYDKIAAGDRLAKMFGFDAPEKNEITLNKGTDLKDVDFVL